MNEPAREYRYWSLLVGRAASLTTKKPWPEMAMSVADVDACNRPWTSVRCRGRDCTPPAE